MKHIGVYYQEPGGPPTRKPSAGLPGCWDAGLPGGWDAGPTNDVGRQERKQMIGVRSAFPADADANDAPSAIATIRTIRRRLSYCCVASTGGGGGEEGNCNGICLSLSCFFLYATGRHGSTYKRHFLTDICRSINEFCRQILIKLSMSMPFISMLKVFENHGGFRRGKPAHAPPPLPTQTWRS